MGELTAEFQEDPELSGNLRMKAVQVAERARVLFDRGKIDGDYDGNLQHVKTIANNAVANLKKVVKRELV